MKKLIECIDSHTCGEPTRLVISGLPKIKGRNIKQKSDFFSKNLDNFRSTLNGEPRGHSPMHSSIFIPLKSKTIDFGLILMSGLGYLDMCGHALIGSITCLIETKKISYNKKQYLNVSTCAGIVRVKPNFNKKILNSITFINSNSFALDYKMKINIRKYRNIEVSFAYGGLWYMLIDSKKLKTKISKKNLNFFITLGKEIRQIVNTKLKKIKNIEKLPNKIPQTLFYENINKKLGKNFVTSDELGFDRSPCGTGSCARLALLYKQNQLKENTFYFQKSIINTTFKTRIVAVNNKKEISPEITGSAYITGFNNIYIDPRDRIKNGFFW